MIGRREEKDGSKLNSFPNRINVTQVKAENLKIETNCMLKHKINSFLKQTQETLFLKISDN
jgi:hypothetical protein